MTDILFRSVRLLTAAVPAVAIALAGCSGPTDDAVAKAAADAAPVSDIPSEPATDADLPPLPAEPAALTPSPEITVPSESSTATEPMPKPVELAQANPAAQKAKPEAGGKAAGGTTGDWPMWGGSIVRNMINATTGLDTSFEAGTTPEEGKNLLWTAPLGSQTYGNPVVAGGKVFVGTNNGGEYRPQHVGDRGVVLCFNEEDGKFLWQLTREKLTQGRVNDWPEQGICSTSCVENGRVYVVTNRCEVMCLDAEGFLDGENDGSYQEETDKEQQDADIVWALDMIDELGVFPHNLATSSPVIAGDNVYIITSNGVDEAHLEIPAPRAPSFIAVNKETGELVWEDNTPFDNILHGQWSSPSVGEVDGKQQIYFAGGDGWIYAMDPAGDGEGGGKILWKFDCNPKDAVYELGGRGTRNEIISTPVFYENSVLVAVGQDPEHGEGVGHLYRIDATKEGDVSPTIEDGSGGWKENPNSAQIWHLGGEDATGDVTGRKGELIFRRTISTAGIADGLVIYPDLSGFVHCIDLETGKRYWEYDMFAACWGSPMVVDGKILIGDEDGELTILEMSKGEDGEAKELAVKEFNSSIYSTPTIANGKMFVSDRSRLYCFKIK
ncbi:MAG: PQQ-binding-like beta-propeller repeat protein [Planctomycetaceae bacterium]